ncbi:MAG: hypothetical protein ACRCYQ_08455 [Nocardioides sp.]
MSRVWIMIAALLLVACGTETERADSPGSRPGADLPSGGHGSGDADPGHAAAEPPAAPLRQGETLVETAMPEPYTPSPPTGVGTDDYRCFLLDTALDRDVFLTGTRVLPGNPSVVHHVILFRVPPEKVAVAEKVDAGEEGPGWTCFGDTRTGDSLAMDDASWLGAWAPGSGEAVYGTGLGVPFPEGSRIIMQVHYNLLAGQEADVSATELRVAEMSAGLRPVTTMLLPAPVELPCRPGRDQSELCDRSAAVADAKRRFGLQPGAIADFLHFVCGTTPVPGPVSSCDRRIRESATIHGVAGHMHLLGKDIEIEVSPGTPRARTVLKIPAWDFDRQAAVPIMPVRLRRGDVVRVTCRHSQDFRDSSPSFDGQPERYVVWGEGSTDEMCLGILQVSRP